VSAAIGADPRWKYFNEAASLRVDETTWVTKARTVLEEKNPQHPSESGEGAVGPGESDVPQWSGT